MGMFDSLIIEFRDNEYELQTKSFEQTLSVYHIGDVIVGAYPGSHSYLDILYLDKEGKQAYSDNYTERFHIIITISETVYCDYQVLAWIEDEKVLLKLLEIARDKWKESHLIISVMLDSLRIYAQKESFYQEQNRTVQQMIDYSKNNINRDKKEEILNFKYLSIDEATKDKIKKGKLLDAIQSELETPEFKSSSQTYRNKEIDCYYL